MLKRSVHLASLLLLVALPATAQPRVVRYHEYHQDSSYTVDNNVCYYIRGARVNQEKGWPVPIYNLLPGETDVVFFQLALGEPLQVVFELKQGATQIQFSGESSVWLRNEYYRSKRKQETRDFVTGTLKFKTSGDSEIIIDGKLGVDSEYPNTHQEILFNQYKTKISGVSDILNLANDAKEKERRELEIVMGLSSIIQAEKKHFWDSVSSPAKYPNNGIKAIDDGETYDLELFESALILDDKRTTLHLRNEAYYSIEIKIDNSGKWTAFFNDTSTTSGSVRILEDKPQSIYGAVDIDFNTGVKLKGTFEVPKLGLADIRTLEERIKRKQQDYLASKR